MSSEEPNTAENTWGFLTDREAEYCQAILGEFERTNYLPLLVATIRNAGISSQSMPFLFELRFAKALQNRGLTPVYEQETVGGTTVDFALDAENANSILAELVSINISDAVTEATQHRTDEDGIEWRSLVLNTNNDDYRFSEEGEVLLVQQKICEKAFRNGQEIKLPHPSENRGWNVLVVDMRGFLGGNGGDNADCVQLCYGNGAVREFERRYWKFRGQRGPIAGLFEVTNPLRGARVVQEKVHGILFTRDKTYVDGGLMRRDNSFLMRNPHLMTTEDQWTQLRDAVRGARAG